MLHFLLFIITIILLCILDIPGKSLSCGMCLIIFSTAKEYSMGTTQPIRNKDELAAFRMYYKDIHPNRRNYCLIVMGLNTALRISDLLKLKWDNVYNFEHHVFRSHFLINEQKTGKNNYVTLNYNATDALRAYFNERHPTEHEFIFTKATCRRQPLNRVQAYRIVSYSKNCCRGDSSGWTYQLSLSEKDIWISRLEERHATCSADGRLQSLVL